MVSGFGWGLGSGSHLNVSVSSSRISDRSGEDTKGLPLRLRVLSLSEWVPESRPPGLGRERGRGLGKSRPGLRRRTGSEVQFKGSELTGPGRVSAGQGWESRGGVGVVDTGVLEEQ